MLEVNKNLKHSAKIKMQNCCEPYIICDGLGYASVRCAKGKTDSWCSKTFCKIHRNKSVPEAHF